MGDLAYKRLHKKLGLCVECQDPAVPGMIRCLEHNFSNQQSRKKYYEKNREMILAKLANNKRKRIENNLCPRCGNFKDEDADDGCIHCMNCRSREWREVNKCN